MNADQVSFALDGVVQPQLAEVAVAGVDVVQVDVFHRGGDDLVLRDVLSRQKEKSAIAEEVLDVAHAEGGLHGNILVAEVIISVKDVGKAHNLGHVLIHARELLKYLRLAHGKRALPARFTSHFQRASAEESVKVGQNLRLQGVDERLIGLFNGDFRAVLGDALNADALGVLGDFDIAVGRGCNFELGERDFLALAHARTARKSAVNRRLVRDQLRSGGLANRAHDAHDLTQSVPVVGETGNKINLSRFGGKLRGGRQSSFSSHILAPFGYSDSAAMLSASAFWRSAVESR